MSKKKILWILNGLLNNGISMFVVNYLSHMDLDKYEYHLGISGNYIDDNLLRRLENLNIKIHIFPCRKKKTVRYFLELKKYIKENSIELCHFHGNSATLTIDLLAAKLAGCKNRIAHCHNSKCDYKIANQLLKPFFISLYTVGVACSDVAAANMFGKNRNSIYIIKNGIDTQKFRFNNECRVNVRKEFNIMHDKIVLGHVGGFNEQKNQKFLIDMFKNLYSINSAYMLVLVGDGEKKQELMQYSSNIGIKKEAILFLGNRSDVNILMNAFDCFLLPSIFEGLGIVAIEAQSIGLSCILSNEVPDITKVTDNVVYLPLDIDKWTYEILGAKYSINERQCNFVRENGWDIRDCVKDLENIYLKEIGEM